jgi:hypothetical protein
VVLRKRQAGRQAGRHSLFAAGVCCIIAVRFSHLYIANFFTLPLPPTTFPPTTTQTQIQQTAAAMAPSWTIAIGCDVSSAPPCPATYTYQLQTSDSRVLMMMMMVVVVAAMKNKH